VEDHSQFKALCALKQTTMRAEVQSIVAQAIALGELSLYVPLASFARSWRSIAAAGR
jgi:hypothetical protein